MLSLMLSRLVVPHKNFFKKDPQLFVDQPGLCSLTLPGPRPHPGLTVWWTSGQFSNHISQKAYDPESGEGTLTGHCSAEQSGIGTAAGLQTQQRSILAETLWRMFHLSCHSDLSEVIRGREDRRFAGYIWRAWSWQGHVPGCVLPRAYQCAVPAETGRVAFQKPVQLGGRESGST